MKKTMIIGNALLWATVILATASTLRNSIYLSQVLPILGGGAAVSLIFTLQRKTE